MSDAALLASLLAFGAFIALPALMAAHCRRASRTASALAASLAEYAAAVRDGVSPPVLDDSLCARAGQLRIPEVALLLLAREMPQTPSRLVADTANRLALRLKRRVAFERKMLARTAPGRRRGAIAASLPPLVLVALHVAGIDLPMSLLLLLLAAQAGGGVLLWRVARVDI